MTRTKDKLDYLPHRPTSRYRSQNALIVADDPSY